MSSIDTIFALSSGKLPAGIAVVRITGNRTRSALESIFGRVPEPRVAALGEFRSDRRVFDRGICLFFPGPNSVTGEDCGELHLHGGVAVVRAALTTLGSLGGVRMAEPGEFTRRAFLNGKIDLIGAEALSDLLSAETEQQLELAGSTARSLAGLYERWRGEILSLRASLESALDFSDQDDVPDLQFDTVRARSLDLASELRVHADRFRQSEIVQSGFNVVIAGAPNAGKSSLLNALALRDAALVSDEPGTTRDAVSVTLDVHGHKIVLTDTAGLRDGPGRVEAMGIERARALMRDADLILRLRDVTMPVFVDIDADSSVLEVGSKVDLGGDEAAFDIVISSTTGHGLERLLEVIGERAAALLKTKGLVWPTRERHVRHVLAAADALGRSGDGGLLPELAAEEMRSAALELGRVVGLTDTEELLGEIFARFCIGK